MVEDELPEGQACAAVRRREGTRVRGALALPDPHPTLPRKRERVGWGFAGRNARPEEASSGTLSILPPKFAPSRRDRRRVGSTLTAENRHRVCGAAVNFLPGSRISVSATKNFLAPAQRVPCPCGAGNLLQVFEAAAPIRAGTA